LVVVGLLGFVMWRIFFHPPRHNSSVVVTQIASPLVAPTPLAPQPARIQPTDSGANNLAVNSSLKDLRDRLLDPRQRDANLQQARLQIEITKSHLFQRLRNLPAERLEQLKTLLAETQLNAALAALPTHADLSPGEMNQIAQTLKGIQTESDSQVRDLLGAEDFAIYEGYQYSEPFRGTIEQVTNIMRARGAVVSADSQESILDAYASAMNAAAQDSGNDGTFVNWGSMTPDQQSAVRVQQLERFDAYLATKMAKVLEPEDYKIFMEAQLAQENSAP